MCPNSFINISDKIVNLSNVSNVNIIQSKNRIVFNLNYNIEISYFDKRKNNIANRFISDYIYWDCLDSNELYLNLSTLKRNKYFRENFIKEANDKGFINKNEISSVKFVELKHRIIFNLSHPVTFVDFNKEEKITSEFVYVNCNDFKQYCDYCGYVKEQLINVY